MMRADSYVYVIYRPSGLPCYVGKGRGERWKRHAKKAKNPHLAAIYAQSNGNLPALKIAENLTDEEACALEIETIALIGRESNGGPLVNLTDGGDGTAGIKVSDGWRENRRRHAKIAWEDPAFRQFQVARMAGNDFAKGKKRPLSAIAQAAEKMKGNQNTKGRVIPEEERARRSAVMKARFADPAWRADQNAKRRAPGGTYDPAVRARGIATRLATGNYFSRRSALK